MWTSIVIYGNPWEFVKLYGSWYAVANRLVVLPAFSHPSDLLQHLFHWHFPWPRKHPFFKLRAKRLVSKGIYTANILSCQPRPSFFCVFSSPRKSIRRNHCTSVTVVSISASAVDSFSPGRFRPGIHISTKKQHLRIPPQRPASCTAACLFGVQYFNDAKKQMQMVYVNMYVYSTKQERDEAL